MNHYIRKIAESSKRLKYFNSMYRKELVKIFSLRSSIKNKELNPFLRERLKQMISKTIKNNKIIRMNNIQINEFHYHLKNKTK